MKNNNWFAQASALTLTAVSAVGINYFIRGGGAGCARTNVAVEVGSPKDEQLKKFYSKKFCEDIRLTMEDVVEHYKRALQSSKENTDDTLLDERYIYKMDRLGYLMHQLQNAYNMVEKGGIEIASEQQYFDTKKDFLLLVGSIPEFIEKEANADPEIRLKEVLPIIVGNWEISAKINEKGELTDILYHYTGKLNDLPSQAKTR